MSRTLMKLCALILVAITTATSLYAGKTKQKEYFRVESFRKLRFKKTKRIQLEILVRWSDPDIDDSWEPYRTIENDLRESCTEMEEVDGFDKVWADLKERSQTGRSALLYRSLKSGARTILPAGTGLRKPREIKSPRIGREYQAEIPTCELRVQATIKRSEKKRPQNGRIKKVRR